MPARALPTAIRALSGGTKNHPAPRVQRVAPEIAHQRQGTIRKCLAYAQRGNLLDDVGRALLAGALIGYPLLAPLMGRPWFAAEIFGIAPDPTAVGTLAVLALADGRMRWLLLLVPCLWCAISGATLWTMGAGGFFVPPLSALIAVGSALAGNQRR